MSESKPSEPVRLLTPKQARRAWLMMLMGLSIYCGVVWYLGWQDVRDELVSADVGLILLSAVIIVSATWLRALKWRYAMGRDSHSVSLYFLSKATGNWTPGRIGEFAPMALKNHRTPRVGAWILFDRIIEIITTLALGLYGLALITLVSVEQFWLAAIGVVVATGAGIYILTRRKWFIAWAGRFKEESFFHKLLMLLAAVSEEFHLFGKSLPITGSITIFTKAVDLWAIILIFKALGYDPTFALMAAAKCALAIVSFIPITPTATFVPHGTQALIMNDSAGSPYDGLLAGIGIEVLVVSFTFWVSFTLALPGIRRAAFS
jgi:uncharacterized membrane protein YbhN (UPF0104 family)